MKKTTVLVIDDDRSFSGIINTTLVTNPKSQYEVIRAQNGEDGLRQVFVQIPDIVLLDIELPAMSGFEVLEKIRRSGNAVPIIMMTANPEPSLRKKAFEAGCNGYMTKPFRTAHLHSNIQRLLTRRKNTMISKYGIPVVQMADIDYNRLDLTHVARKGEA